MSFIIGKVSKILKRETLVFQLRGNFGQGETLYFGGKGSKVTQFGEIDEKIGSCYIFLTIDQKIGNFSLIF